MLAYIQINTAKPKAKPYSLTDALDLHIVIQPNGQKLWRLRYRFLDKQKTLHLGGWPQVSLSFPDCNDSHPYQD
ncbi:Arm DNA-binding domain-containing protein [Sphingomonas canadensis]|uniref:Arm DNA-binding domain-containing protein n=2 Tax=Sphingomonas canadensis TaxID=1219257 RepID=A0ABW3H6W2_9SPHN|nr:Arm DNA-binding domain-containing protein [Sphingomonas canadensis]MCW3835080.1 Arm DNA-binding domain-containing protein [Sphingomonas canadensis]